MIYGNFIKKFLRQHLFMPFKSGFNSLYLDMSGRTLRVAPIYASVNQLENDDAF